MRLVIKFIPLLMILAGCSLKKIDLNLPTQSVAIERKSEILARLNAEVARLKSYRVFGIAKNNIGDDTYRVRYLFASRHPEDLHFQSLPINSGIALTVLKSNGINAVLLDNGPRIAYTAKGDKNLLEKALGAPILSSDVQYLLSGRVPERILNSSPSVFEGSDNILISDAARREVYEIDTTTFLLKKATVLTSSKRSIAWNAQWDAYEETHTGVMIPTLMVLEIPSKSYQGTFSWRSMEYNPNLNDALFDPKVPEGWDIEQHR